MRTVKTMLVDDEPLALSHLENILKKNCNDIEIIGTANVMDEALEKILFLKPDLVFLDIELGGETGFDLLKKCVNRNFEVIFVTAHDQFGIEAIKQHAFDYLLKPINKVELMLAVSNVCKAIEEKKNISYVGHFNNPVQKLSLPTMEGLIFIEVSDIAFLESEGRYTRFHLRNNQKHIVSKNLGEYEKELETKGFARIHNSYIVNLEYVEKYIKGRGGYVILKNGTSLEVSTRKKDDFLDKLS